jgi:hypothetical protein
MTATEFSMLLRIDCHAPSSQSASVTCFKLARVVPFLVLHVNIVFMLYCVNILIMWSKLLVFRHKHINSVYNNTEGERRRWQVLHRQARALVYKVFSYLKRETEAICTCNH